MLFYHMRKESFNLLLMIVLGVAYLSLGASAKPIAKINLKVTPLLIHPAKGARNQSVNPVTIEGYYTPAPPTESNEACDLSVRIIKTKGVYYYTFNMAGKIYKGKVKLIKTAGTKDIGITFTGIKWAEYEGDVSNAKDGDRPYP